MKRHCWLPLFLLCLVAPLASAQDAAAPVAPALAPAATPAIEPPQLIPSPPLPPAATPNAFPNAAGNPDLSQLDAIFKKTPLGKSSQDYEFHVEWRQLENLAAGDREVLDARAAIDASPTDLVKRTRSATYYQIYFKKMRSLATAPELKAYLDAKLAGQLGLLAQARVRPESMAKSN